MTGIVILEARNLVVGASTPKPRRARKPTLASIAKQASRANIEVGRYEIERDKITIVTGKAAGEADQANDLDNWMAKHHAH
jgi:anti-sigma-K factor RskA